MNVYERIAIKTLTAFPSPQLGRCTNIHVCLPPDYDGSAKRYPVLYLQDGQSVFMAQPQSDGESLEADKTSYELFFQGRSKGCILVAIESDGAYRRQEYNPEKLRPADPLPRTDAYGAFITETLKPFIDKTLRTLPGREFTGIAGFSAGAACSLYVGLRHQAIFSKVAAFSLTLTKSFYTLLQTDRTLSKSKSMRLYMDIGRHEASGLPKEIRDCFVEDFTGSLQSLRNRLTDLGYEQEALRLVIDEEGGHGLAYAARRFPEAFLWLYDDTLCNV